MDALVAMADMTLANPPGERSGGDRTQVVVHVDAAVLTDAGEGRCGLENGPAISAATARRLACDSSVVRMLERAGEPLSVGRKTRTIPPALRRALKTRDGSCQFSGCNNSRYLDAHHLEHWAKGGKTSLDNLILLCRKHHRLLHEGECTLEHDRNGDIMFRNRHGVVIAPVPRPPPRSHHEALHELNEARGLNIDDNTLQVGGEHRMDLAYAVDGIIDCISSHG